MEQSTALTAFQALSQATRLDVLRLLIQSGTNGLYAGDIAAKLDVRQNTLSTNLSILSQASLIQSIREGRKIRYKVNFDGLRGLLTFLLEDCCGGDTTQCQPIFDTLCCKESS